MKTAISKLGSRQLQCFSLIEGMFGPVQTSHFSCAEYNSRIICIRSATSETIKFGRFELQV